MSIVISCAVAAWVEVWLLFLCFVMSCRTVEFPFDNKVPSIHLSIYRSINLSINPHYILRHRLNSPNVKKKMNARACPCRLPAQCCVFSQLVQAVACCGQLVCVWSYCGSATQTRFYLNISVVLAAKRPSYPLHWSSHQELCPLCDVQASVLCVCAHVCVSVLNVRMWEYADDIVWDVRQRISVVSTAELTVDRWSRGSEWWTRWRKAMFWMAHPHLWAFVPEWHKGPGRGSEQGTSRAASSPPQLAARIGSSGKPSRNTAPLILPAVRLRGSFPLMILDYSAGLAQQQRPAFLP